MATLGLPWVVLISGILHCNILQGNAHRFIATNLTGAEHAEGYVNVTVAPGASLNAKFMSHSEARSLVESATHATNGVMIPAPSLGPRGKSGIMACDQFKQKLLSPRHDEDEWTEELLKEWVQHVGEVDCEPQPLFRTPLFSCIQNNRYAIAAKLLKLGADPRRIVRIAGKWTRASVFEEALLEETPVMTGQSSADFSTFLQALKDCTDKKLLKDLRPEDKSLTRRDLLVWSFQKETFTGNATKKQNITVSTYQRFKERVGRWSGRRTPKLTKDDTDKFPLLKYEAVRNLWKSVFDKKWWKGKVGK